MGSFLTWCSCQHSNWKSREFGPSEKTSLLCLRSFLKILLPSQPHRQLPSRLTRYPGRDDGVMGPMGATSVNALFALLLFADVETEAYREDLAHGKLWSKRSLKN